MTTIKAVYGDDTRRLNIEAGTTLSSLQGLLKERFNLATVTLKWVDEDGDACTLAEEDDLTEALSSTDKLRIIVNGTASEPSPSTTPVDPPKAPEREEEQKQRSPATPCGLFKLFQHFKQPCGNATTAPAEHPFAGMIRGAMQHAAKAAQEAGEKATAEAEKATPEAKNSPSSASSPAIHLGVSCDVSGQCPIVGVRYQKRGANYDLCQAEFEKLSPEAQAAYEAINQPQMPFCGGAPFGFPFAMPNHGAAEAGGFAFSGAFPAEGQLPPVHFLEMIQRAAAVAEQAAAEAAAKMEKEAAENPDAPPEALSFAQSITQAVQQAAKAAQKAAAEAAEKAAAEAAERADVEAAASEAAASQPQAAANIEESDGLTCVQEPSKPPAYEETSDTPAEFPTPPTEAQEEAQEQAAQEQAAEEAVTASSGTPVSLEDAISALGVGEGALSASIMHEIQEAVNVNAEEAERRLMEESAAEAERQAERKAQEEAQRAEEERLTAEAAAQKEAEEKAAEQAAAEAAEQAANDAESQERAALLLQMGFSEDQVQGALEATQGSLERAADWLFVNAPQTEPEQVEPAFPEEWEQLAADLAEMGFDADRAKEQLVKAEGNFKLAIKALVEAERGAM